MTGSSKTKYSLERIRGGKGKTREAHLREKITSLGWGKGGASDGKYQLPSRWSIGASHELTPERSATVLVVPLVAVLVVPLVVLVLVLLEVVEVLVLVLLVEVVKVLVLVLVEVVEVLVVVVLTCKVLMPDLCCRR